MNQKEKAFVKTVKEYYRTHKRADLPWRIKTDPYTIVVSELMLQQTQVARVVPKFISFMERFPTVPALAGAPFGDVLKAWQGLGYNRRAKLLHACVKTVAEKYQGVWPDNYDTLIKLPGIGPYTAGAVLAFAYNQAVPIIETNIRTVYIYHFFRDQQAISESDILVKVRRTLDMKSPRTWYWTLMDYGSHLKATKGNLNQQAKSYTKQSTFKGSDRQIRGAIIRQLTKKPTTRNTLLKLLSQFEDIRIDAQIEKLITEQLIAKKANSYRLPE